MTSLWYGPLEIQRLRGVEQFGVCVRVGPESDEVRARQGRELLRHGAVFRIFHTGTLGCSKIGGRAPPEPKIWVEKKTFSFQLILRPKFIFLIFF